MGQLWLYHGNVVSCEHMHYPSIRIIAYWTSHREPPLYMECCESKALFVDGYVDVGGASLSPEPWCHPTASMFHVESQEMAWSAKLGRSYLLQQSHHEIDCEILLFMLNARPYRRRLAQSSTGLSLWISPYRCHSTRNKASEYVSRERQDGSVVHLASHSKSRTQLPLETIRRL